MDNADSPTTLRSIANNSNPEPQEEGGFFDDSDSDEKKALVQNEEPVLG